jgi:hypothetical protein
MYKLLDKYWDQFLYMIDHSQPQHWIMVLAGVILVGYLLLKSMGSKPHY